LLDSEVELIGLARGFVDKCYRKRKIFLDCTVFSKFYCSFAVEL